MPSDGGGESGKAEKEKERATTTREDGASRARTLQDTITSFLVPILIALAILISAIRDGHITPQSFTNLALALMIPVVAILWALSALLAPLLFAWLSDSQQASSTRQRTRTFEYNASLRRIMQPMNLARIYELEKSLGASRSDPIHPSSSVVSASADDIVRLILRDFVESWHTPLLHGTTSRFSESVERSIRESLTNLVARLSGIDIASMAVQELLPEVTSHMIRFYAAEAKLHEGSRQYVQSDDDGDMFLAGLYDHGRLHPAVGSTASPNTRATEIDHLRKLSTKILRGVMPVTDRDSRPVFILVREILTCSVLKNVIDNLCDPDTLNNIIDERVGAALQEQRLVSRLREALDRQGGAIASATGLLASTSSKTARKGDKTNESFESFLEKVSSYSSILEARRMRNDLTQQIRKTKAEIAQANQDTSSNSRRAALQSYLSRLERALEALERRLEQLSATRKDDTSGSSATLLLQPAVAVSKNIDLFTVLTSPSAISHFLEFAEARHRSTLVQFWLSVNSFKNPLEDVESGSEDEELEASSSFKDVKTLCEDIQLFTEHYYSSPLIAQCVKSVYIDTAKEFVQTMTAKPRATQMQIRRVRQSVIRAQRQVYEEMLEEDWPIFQKSPRWYKVLDDVNRNPTHLTTIVNAPIPEAEHENDDLVAVSKSRSSKGGTAGSRVASDSTAGRRYSHHNDLFGDEASAHPVSPFEILSDNLASSSDQGGQSTSTRTPSYSHDIEQLMGGKGGSTFDGLDGRTPLFREALFEEDDEMGREEGSREGDDLLEARDGFVRIDKMDAIESALANILHEDMGTTDNARLRPKAAQRSASAKELRPAFRRSSPSKHPDQVRAAIFDDEDEVDHGSSHSHQQTGAQQHQESFRHFTLEDLAARLGRVEKRVLHLFDQQSVLDALVRKGELTGSSEKEMRLLQKSQNSLARELRELEFERAGILDQQMEADDIRIDPVLTQVQIQQATTKVDAEGKEFALYFIEVSNSSPSNDGGVQNGWVVTRRYNDFYLLHTKLKESYHEARSLEPLFPGKRLVGLVHTHFVEARRMALEKYLRAVVRSSPAVCQSGELKAFLKQSNATITAELLNVAASRYAAHLLSPSSASVVSPSSSNAVRTPGIVSSLFKSVTGVAEGFDDFLFGPSMLDIVLNRLSTSNLGDLVSLPDFERLAAITTQHQPKYRSVSAPSEVAVAAELKDVASTRPPDKIPPFTAPICDALVELFELKREDNWLRRLALVMVLQQALGSTIERSVSVC